MFATRRISFFIFYAFLLCPIVIVVLSSVAPSGYFAWPVEGLTLDWYVKLFASKKWLMVILASTLIAIAAAFVSTICALSSALVIDRSSLLSRRLFELAVVMPLVFPHVATAIALLGILRRTDLLGTYLGIVIAHIIITIPFAFSPILTSVRSISPSIHQAASSLGATPVQILYKVTLPLVKNGVVTAFLFCFLISFDEATITMFIVTPEMNTLPVEILENIQWSTVPIVPAVSTFLVIIAIILVSVINRYIGLDLFAGTRRKLT